jgi:CRISPR/Cas system-associated exonuclease Cas4 (RecB family)
MSRPTVILHHISQWLAQPPEVRSVILQHIKLKDRLLKWRREYEQTKPAPTDQAKWVPCSKCEGRGHVLSEPRYPGIHPSQLPHACLLKVYWEMEGREGQEKHESRTLFTFDIGHAVHHMLQTYGMKGAWGAMYTPESRINSTTSMLAGELFVVGSADAENILIIDDIPNSPIYELGIIHEYKTIKQENFQKLTKPKPEHLRQATIYGRLLDRPVVVYLYVNKNDSNMSDYPVQYDPGMWQPLEEKARLLLGYYESEQEPQATTGYHCQQCPYAYGCPAYRGTQKSLTARR